MAETMTITLPADVKQALDEFSQNEGVSTNEVVGQAVKEHVFLRRFHSLRARMAEKAEKQGVVTDQDVFDRVS